MGYLMYRIASLLSLRAAAAMLAVPTATGAWSSVAMLRRGRMAVPDVARMLRLGVELAGILMH